MRLGLSLVVAMTATIATTAVAQPHGKIVRIERPGHHAGVLRFCDVRADKEASQCFGPIAPVKGDLVSVVDDTHKVIDLKVATVTPMQDTCKVAWLVTYDGITPDLAPRGGIVSGVIGGAIGPRGHRVTTYDRKKIPDGFPEEQIIFAIDRDGNEQPEIAVSLFMCDKSGQPSATGDDFCINLWAIDNNDRFTKTSALSGVRDCLSKH
ncbi:MAG: hypothetical protein NT062_26595 [Proteobacteria bacterium]|nr:hypothetical protein [Pseudomonadota bacterium]